MKTKRRREAAFALAHHPATVIAREGGRSNTYGNAVIAGSSAFADGDHRSAGADRASLEVAAETAHTVIMPTTMTIFKCPHCSAQYEMIVTHISFRQRSYANCQVCWKAMYSWTSNRVPRFTLLVQPDNTPAP
jgi:hypothetical protein